MQPFPSEAANELALRYGVPLILHVAETRAELDEVKKRYGKKPFRTPFGPEHPGPSCDCGPLRPPGRYGDQRIVEHDVKPVHNPESNMKLASGVSPVFKLLKQGVTVGLGTDGCASNNNLDLFAEMDTAAKLNKVEAMDPTVLDALTVLRMTTSMGAKC
jgi:5-methylthioadenosine/S-adenosylhomocysteine deaminase